MRTHARAVVIGGGVVGVSPLYHLAKKGWTDSVHRDEVVVSIAGEQHWLWRAVDQNGFVLDVLVQRRRDAQAARRLMKRLLKSAVTPPRVMIADKLRSYGAAQAKMGLRIEHRQHKRLNNRAENSHRPTRRRERIMKRDLIVDRQEPLRVPG
jgi:putative transposase